MLKEVVLGDLGLVFFYNMMKSLIEMIEVLDYVMFGLVFEYMLFYGVEVKFYFVCLKLNDKFEIEIFGLYVGGDGVGIM